MFFFKPPTIAQLKARRDVKGLIRMLRPAVEKRDFAQLRLVAKALGDLGDARAVEPLLDALSFSDRSIAWEIAEALGNIGDPRAVPTLIALLNSRDTFIANQAIEALGKIGDPRAIPPLIAVLKNKPSDRSLDVIAKALGSLGGPEAVEGLLFALEEKEKINTKKRNSGATIIVLEDTKEITNALCKLGDERVINMFVSKMMEKNNNYRREAADALEKLHWQPDRSEIGATYHVFKSQWDQCVSIGSPAVQPLIDALRSRLRGVESYKLSCAKTLARIGDHQAVQPIMDCLVEPYYSRFTDEDGEIYAAGAAAEQSDKEELLRYRLGLIDVIREFESMDGVDPAIKASIDNFLKSYSPHEGLS